MANNHNVAGFQVPPAYIRNVLRQSERRRLLVEGPDDSEAFSLLLDELLGCHHISILNVQFIKLDDIPELHSLDPINRQPGNRKRVELICARVNRSINEASLSNKIVGFVDREFDGFKWQNDFADQIQTHKVLQDIQVVYTRGHSLENYCFEFDILREAFRGYSQYFGQALELFEQIFENTIRLACAITLAAKEFTDQTSSLKKGFELIKRSIDWKLLNIHQPEIGIDLVKWEKQLQQRQNLQYRHTQEFIVLFQKWLEKIQYVDFQIIRWLCHGHIGFTVLAETYTCCVSEVCSNLDSDHKTFHIKRVMRHGYEDKWNHCVKVWIQKSKSSQCLYPKEVLDLLGVNVV